MQLHQPLYNYVYAKRKGVFPDPYNRLKERRVMPAIGIRKKSTPQSSSCNELKWYDTSIASQAIGNYSPYTTFAESLNLIPAGASGDSRTGRKVIIRSVNINFHLNHTNITAASPSTDHFCRILVVKDRQNNGAQVVPDFVVSTSRGFPELANKERFTILKTITRTYKSNITYNGTNLTAQGIREFIPVYLKLNLPVLYAEDNPTISDVTSNNILVLAWSDLDTRFELQMTARVRFND